MQNLLDRFALVQTQLSRLNAELHDTVAPDQPIKARVEFKLTPREAPGQGGGTPCYQVSAALICRGTREGDEQDNPLFILELVLHALYRQMRGAPAGFEEFRASHLSLTRQLYPLMYQQLQPVLRQFGLDRLRMPHDLFDQPREEGQAGKAPVH